MAVDYSQYLAEKYFAYLGSQSSKVLDQKARDGGWIGYAPTGYRNVRTEKGTKVEIDLRLGPLVKRAFKLAQQKSTSLRLILDTLTSKGLISRTGKPLGPSALLHILNNPFYTSLIRYKGKYYQGAHQSLISRALFERVQERLKKRRRRVDEL